MISLITVPTQRQQKITLKKKKIERIRKKRLEKIRNSKKSENQKVERSEIQKNQEIGKQEKSV